MRHSMATRRRCSYVYGLYRTTFLAHRECRGATMMSEEMTLRMVDGVVHLVYATDVSTITTLCGRTTSYLPDEISDSWNDPPTCFWCVIPNRLRKRPPFEPSD